MPEKVILYNYHPWRWVLVPSRGGWRRLIWGWLLFRIHHLPRLCPEEQVAPQSKLSLSTTERILRYAILLLTTSCNRSIQGAIAMRSISSKKTTTKAERSGWSVETGDHVNDLSGVTDSSCANTLLTARGLSKFTCQQSCVRLASMVRAIYRLACVLKFTGSIWCLIVCKIIWILLNTGTTLDR